MNLTSGKGELNLSPKIAAIHRTSVDVRQAIITFIVVLVFGSLLYLALGTTNYSGDDLIEVQSIKEGGISLLPPNHMLYRPLARAIFDVMVSFGYTGHTILPARIVIGVSATLGVGLFYLWMMRLVQARSVALITTLGFGTSWAYWVFGIGTMYMTPAVTCVLGALVALWSIFSRPETEIARKPLAVVSLMTALAILFWEANIFFIPCVLLGLWVKYRTKPVSVAKAAAAYLVISGTLTLAIYILASVALFGPSWSIDNFVSWATGRGGSARLASWGVMDISRVRAIVPTLVAIVLPYWEGFGLRQLISGEFQSEKILPLLSVPALGLLVLVPGLVLAKSRGLSSAKRNTVLGLIVGALFYVPFNIWWDPRSVSSFLIPSIALWGVLGILWKEIASARFMTGLFAVLVATITLANFSVAIWPRHTNPNLDLEQASCIAEYLDHNDLYVSNWEAYQAYLGYFYHIETFTMIDTTIRLGGPEIALDALTTKLETVKQRGGQVYVADMSTYSQDTLRWLYAETGIEQSHLERLQGMPAFACGSTTHYVLNNLPSIAEGQETG